MIILDASVGVSIALGQERAISQVKGVGVLLAPYLIDAEVLQSLRGLVLGRKVTEQQGLEAVGNWQKILISRRSVHDLSSRVWELRHNVTAYDASYVVLAEAYQCPLLTADRRLAAADGPRCAIMVVGG